MGTCFKRLAGSRRARLEIAMAVGLVLDVPFLWTYVIMLAVDDCGKLVLYLPRFASMKWIQPVARHDG